MSTNEVKITLTQTTERTLILPEYFTVADLKRQLEGLGYNLSGMPVQTYIRHKQQDWESNQIMDNTYLTEGDSVHIVTVDSFNAMKELEREVKAQAIAEQAQEENEADETIETSIRVHIFA